MAKYIIQKIPGIGVGVVRVSPRGKFLVDVATTKEQAEFIIEKIMVLEANLPETANR